jgi:hypothetical protein
VIALCSRAPAIALENPRQTPAWQYPREYGPVSPGFSRGALLDADSAHPRCSPPAPPASSATFRAMPTTSARSCWKASPTWSAARRGQREIAARVPAAGLRGAARVPARSRRPGARAGGGRQHRAAGRTRGLPAGRRVPARAVGRTRRRVHRAAAP